MGVLQQLGALDFSRLDIHLRSANGTVSVSGSASLTSFEPKELLADLAPLLRMPESLPSNPQQLQTVLTAALGDLGKIVDLPDLNFLDDVGMRFRQLASVIEKVVAQLGGAGGLDFNQLLTDGGGIETFLHNAVSGLGELFPTEVPPVAQPLLDVVEALSRGTLTSPQELAEVITKFAVGIDLGGLNAPSARLAEMLAALRAAGGNLDPIRAGIENLTAQVREATLLLGGEAPDINAAINLLGQARAALDALTGNLLPVAVGRLTLDLASLDVGRFATNLEAAVQPLLALMPATSLDLDIERSMVAPIRGIVVQVEALTAETVAQLFTDLETRFKEAAATVGLDEVPVFIDELFDGIVEQMQRVPLRELRDQLLDAMIGMESRIRAFAGFQLPYRLADHIQSIADAIDNINTAAIQQKVDELVSKINGAVSQFPVNEIKHELEGLIGSVSEAIGSFTPAIDAASKQLDDFAQQVASIDFDQAAEASINLMGDIRNTVKAAVGSGDIPEPLKIAIAAGAGALKQIDFSIEIRAPFDQLLASIDVGVLLAPIQEAMAKVREVIEKVTPSAIIKQLDGPFSVLLAQLDRLKPAALLAGISEEFNRLVGFIDALDPRNLVAPLEAEFQRLVSAFRQALDPAPLFEPLKTAYGELQELIDLIDPHKALGQVVGKIADMPKVLGDSLQAALAARAGSVPQLPAVAATPFRFGDVIRPIAILIAQIRKAIERAAEAVLSEAITILDAPIAALRRLRDPASGVLSQAAAVLDERTNLLNLEAESGPMVELRFALAELAATAASVNLSGDAEVQVSGSVAALQLDARVPGLATAKASLDAQIALVHDRITPPDLGSTLRRLAEFIDELMPAELLNGDAAATGATRIGAMFDSLNLMPLANELDQLGARIEAKLMTFTAELTRGLIRLWDSLIRLLEPVMPDGLLARVGTGMDRIRAEVAVMDPAVIEKEAEQLLDAVVEGLNAYSPATLAAELGIVFDAVKAKVQTLNPPTLLGNLDPVGAVIQQFEQLRPSVVLAPLTNQTQTLEDALKNLMNLKLGDAVIEAVAKLKADLEGVITNLQQELNGLLDDLGTIDASASVSVSV